MPRDEPHAYPLKMWAVYDGPRDYPDQIVARLWLVQPGKLVATDQVLIAPNIELVRAQIGPDYVRLPPDALDDPVIVEVWI